MKSFENRWKPIDSKSKPYANKGYIRLFTFGRIRSKSTLYDLEVERLKISYYTDFILDFISSKA
jgi:hypothetical protein